MKKKEIYTTLGASNHCKEEREINDFYATDPSTIDDLLQYEQFDGTVWEPAAGMGHLTDALRSKGIEVEESDILDRSNRGFKILDFYKTNLCLGDNIITNPPYSKALDFVKRALDKIKPGKKIAMFLKLTFLESQSRKKFFQNYPPETVYVYSARKGCGKNGEFKTTDSKAIAYAWFVWKKDVYNNPVIKWI